MGVVVRAIYSPSLVRVVDAILLIIGVIERFNRRELIENSCASGVIDAPLVALISAIIALELAEDDDGAFLDDTHCIGR